MRTVPLEFFVPGKPITQGSMRAIAFKGRDGKTHAVAKHDNKRAKPWRSAIAEAARLALAGGDKFVGQALELHVVFGLERPKGHYRSGCNAHLVRDSAPSAPDTKPDLDKLTRAVGDALEGVVYDQDSRIVRLQPVKVYVPRGAVTGAAITVRLIQEQDLALFTDRFLRMAEVDTQASAAGA